MQTKLFERYSFVAITTGDLDSSRNFWVNKLGFPVTEEKPGDHFIVDAGGLRLCVDTANGDQHKIGSTDPVIGLKVESVDEASRDLRERGITHEVKTDHGRYIRLLDPDGRCIVITETD